MTDNIEDLIHALGSNRSEGRNDATQKLINCASGALPTLLNVFASEYEAPIVKAPVVYILGLIGDGRAVGPLASYVEMGYKEPKQVDFNILERVPLALGMIVQSLLQDPDKRTIDPTINTAVNSLVKSLFEKTLEYREGGLFSHNDQIRAIHENVTYRLNVIEAFKMIGDVNAIIDTLGFILRTKPSLEEIVVLVSAAEALGWIGATHFYKEYYSKNKEEGGSIERASFNTKLAIDILKNIIYHQPEMYREVRETARKALKLITGRTD